MFKNLLIKWKLAALVGVTLAALATVAITGFMGLNRVSGAMTEIGEVRLPSVEALMTISEGQTAAKAASLEAAIHENNFAAQQAFTRIVEQKRLIWSRIEGGWKQYEPLPQTPEEAVLWKQFVAEWEGWKAADGKLTATLEALSSNKDEATQKELFTQFYQQYEAAAPLFLKSEATLSKIVDLNKRVARESVKGGSDAEAAANTLMLAVLAVSVVVAVGCSLYISALITGPINEAVKIAQTVAAGDLTSRIEASTKEETGQLLAALKAMNDSLVRIVADVRNGSDQIASASGQIATGNLDLSSRTEEQASSLEETASSMEELTSTVRQNAENARQANQMAVAASEIAGKGGAVVSEVVQTMGAINDSARKIVDIITVIDGIAFQTNILALNAAVEAARAGEQGRGFAVVAGEVRNLAQRAASAAKEIKGLIDDSVEKVDSGAKLVDQAGVTMAEVVASVKRVTDIMGEITAASQEQSAGIEQVNQAITQMDEVTQQNAALVEEAAAAASSLQEQAGKLADLVSVFKVDASFTPAAAPVAAPAPKAAPQRQLVRKPAAPAPLPAGAGKKVPAMAAHDGGEDWEEF